mmetsp:Transcript_11202/g.16798  ORF Transcript_11202/g.16798 Transcript_11202/m.16798 type:complete len:328 (+) Transcript_11202:1041-2024(+)
MIFWIRHLGERVKVISDHWLALFNPLVEWLETRLVVAKRAEIEQILKDTRDDNQVATCSGRDLSGNDLLVAGFAIGIDDSDIDKPIVDKVTCQLEDIVMGSIWECLDDELAQLLANPTQTVWKTFLALENCLQKAVTDFLEHLGTFIDNLLDVWVFQSLLVVNITGQIRLLASANFGFIDHRMVDCFWIELKIVNILLEKALHRWTQHLLEIFETCLAAIIRDHHLWHNGFSRQKVTHRLDDRNFTLNSQLKQLEDEKLFTRRECITIQCEDGGVEKLFHILWLDKIHKRGKVARLGLQQIKEILVVGKLTGRDLDTFSVCARLLAR